MDVTLRKSHLSTVLTRYNNFSIPRNDLPVKTDYEFIVDTKKPTYVKNVYIECVIGNIIILWCLILESVYNKHWL